MRTIRAFTLIELLVVIAIIAILAAILFPVFAQAKEAAKKTTDLSNCKNHATAIMLYMGDSDDNFPRQCYKRPNSAVWGWNTPFTWREAVQPYVKNGNGVYDDGKNKVILAEGGVWDTPAKPNVRGAYNVNRIIMPGYCYWSNSANSWLCDSTDDGYPNGRASMPSVALTALDAPAAIIMTMTVGIHPEWKASGDFTEGSWYWWGGAQWPPIFTGPKSGEKWDADSAASPSYAMPRYRYSGGMNNSYADGHARFTKKGALHWCKVMYVKGLSTDWGDSWDWLFDPGQPCAAFAR